MPNKKIKKMYDFFGIINLSSKILKQAMEGPTNDLEDNIQLYSAQRADCDYFLTNDKRLLKMTFFGKTKIVSKI